MKKLISLEDFNRLYLGPSFEECNECDNTGRCWVNQETPPNCPVWMALEDVGSKDAPPEQGGVDPPPPKPVEIWYEMEKSNTPRAKNVLLSNYTVHPEKPWSRE